MTAPSLPPAGEADIAALAAVLTDSQRVAVFTGAGMSTESGIPDFRSPGGVWSRMKPIYFQEFVTSAAARQEAWRRRFSNEDGWVGAKPNHGHAAIAQLVRAGKVFSVITQNVDNLHQDSGVPAEQVIELHGNATYARCLACQVRIELDALAAEFQANGAIGPCQRCGGIVKTATISFGQSMPVSEMQRAATAASTCDLMLVLGSSLSVFPAADVPILARTRGARLIIINAEATQMDDLADLVIHAAIGPTLRAVLRRLA